MRSAAGIKEFLNLFCFTFGVLEMMTRGKLQIPGTRCDLSYFKSNGLFAESFVHKSATSLSETTYASKNKQTNKQNRYTVKV